MIPFARYSVELAAVAAAFSVRVVDPVNAGEPVVDLLEVVDRGAAIAALHDFHLSRWNRPKGEAGPAENRRQDLAELGGAMLLMFAGLQDDQRVYPLALSAPGLTSDDSGVDVIGYRLENLVGDLVPAERLGIVEAKTVEKDGHQNALTGLQDDVKKASAARIGDTLSLHQWELEVAGDHNQFRLHQFLTSGSYWWGVILIDPNLVNLNACIASAQNRLKDKVTPIASPVTRVLIVSIPDSLDFVHQAL